MNESGDRAALPAPDVEPHSSDAPLGKEKAAGFDSRVNITVTSYRRRKHDPDGISAKAVLDGLVRAGIIADDSTSEVESIAFKSVIIKKDEDEKTIIEIE